MKVKKLIKWLILYVSLQQEILEEIGEKIEEEHRINPEWDVFGKQIYTKINKSTNPQ